MPRHVTIKYQWGFTTGVNGGSAYEEMFCADRGMYSFTPLFYDGRVLFQADQHTEREKSAL